MSTLRINLLSSLLSAMPLNIDRYQQTRRLMEFSRYLPMPSGIKTKHIQMNGVPSLRLNYELESTRRHILYLHGGAYVVGGIASHRQMVARLAKAAHAHAFLIDYRLAPEHPYPAALEDAEKAYNWLLEQGIAPEDIALAGDSAGAGLALCLLQKLKAEERPLPAVAVLICPWLDLSCESESMNRHGGRHPLLTKDQLLKAARMYAPNMDLKDPKISPLYGDVTGLPRIFIQAGAQDPLRDDATRLAEKLESNPHETTIEIWPDMFHDWHLFGLILPDGDWATKRAGQVIRTSTAKGKKVDMIKEAIMTQY